MRVRLRSFFLGLPLLTIMVLMIFWRGMYALPRDDHGKSFPTTNLPILFDSEKRFQKEDLTGSVSLVNFWASWCMACQQEHPILLWIHKNYPINTIGINFQDDVLQAKAMLMRYGNPYKTVIDDSGGVSAYTLGINVLPQTFLVDKKGKIRYHHAGVVTRHLFEYTILPIIQEIEKE